MNIIGTFEMSKIDKLMKYKLGFISTEQSFELLKEYTEGLGFEVVGYINANDFINKGFIDYTMADQFLNQVDSIAIEHDFNEPDLLTYFIRQSKHLLFLDKISGLLDCSDELEQLLHESGTVLQIANLERNKPVYTSLRQYLKCPKYCRLERWTTSHINMADQLVDDIDMAVSCFDSRIADVSCHTGTIFNKNIDLVNIKLTFQNGANADILLHAAGAESKSQGLFVAENGYYQVDFSNQDIVEIVHASDEQLSLIEDMSGKQKLTKFEKKILSYNPIRKAFQNFAENMEHGFTPLVNIADAKNIAYVLQKAQGIMQRNCVNWA